MICDSIRNRHLYAGIAPEIKMALDYCAKMYEEGFREGDDVLADNVTMKCHPVTTRPMSALTWEAHHRAIDIHFIVEGGEKNRLYEPPESDGDGRSSGSGLYAAQRNR